MMSASLAWAAYMARCAAWKYAHGVAATARAVFLIVHLDEQHRRFDLVGHLGACRWRGQPQISAVPNGRQAATGTSDEHLGQGHRRRDLAVKIAAEGVAASMTAR